MVSWDCNQHLDTAHTYCSICEGYVADQQALTTHIEREHTIVEPHEVDKPKASSTPKQDETNDSEIKPEPVDQNETHEPEIPVTMATKCQNRLKCKFCGKELDSEEKLNKHILNHKVIPCPECSKIFLKMKHRDQHIKDAHKALASFYSRKLKCKQSAPNEMELHNHMRSDHWDFFKCRSTGVHMCSRT